MVEAESDEPFGGFVVTSARRGVGGDELTVRLTPCAELATSLAAAPYRLADAQRDAFHVTCAQRAGLHMDFEDTSVYCKKHTPGATPAGRANGNGRGGKAKQQRKRKRS